MLNICSIIVFNRFIYFMKKITDKDFILYGMLYLRQCIKYFCLVFLFITFFYNRDHLCQLDHLNNNNNNNNNSYNILQYFILIFSIY